MNNNKGLNIVRVISVAVLALYLIFAIAGSVFNIPLSDAAMRFTGIIGMLALPLAVFASMRIHFLKKEGRC